MPIKVFIGTVKFKSKESLYYSGRKMPWLFWKKKKPIDKVIEKTIKNIEKIKGVDKDLKKMN